MRKIKFLVNPNDVGHRLLLKYSIDNDSNNDSKIKDLTYPRIIDLIEEMKQYIVSAEIWGNDYSNNQEYKCVAIYE